MEADLVGRLFEFCQGPKRFPTDFTIYKVLHIDEDGIVCHWPFHDVVIMRESKTACCNEIKPFLCHFWETLDI